jgi:hypothetical protein
MGPDYGNQRVVLTVIPDDVTRRQSAGSLRPGDKPDLSRLAHEAYPVRNVVGVRIETDLQEPASALDLPPNACVIDANHVEAAGDPADYMAVRRT